MHWYMRQHWFVKLVLVLVAIYVAMNLVLLTAGVSAATVPTTTNADVATQEYTDSTDLILAPPAQTGGLLSSLVPSGCHGRVYRTMRIYMRLTNITIAWRRTAIDRWCGNNRGQIYDWGAATGDDGKYSVAGYCWYNVTYGKVWWTVSKSEAKVWNQGTLQVCGKLSLSITVNPRIYFHAATSTRPYLYWNYGGTTIYH